VKNLVEDVINILIKYPLCNRCLGRLYAYLGRELDNAERGKALKIYTIMELHKRILEGDETAFETLKSIAPNIKIPLKSLFNYLKINSKIETSNEIKKCFVCNDTIDDIINVYSNLVAKQIIEAQRKSFLIGIILPNEILEREAIIIKEFKLKHWESIKRELKREIGKKVQQISNTNVDFEKPEAIYIIDLIHNTIRIESPSLLIFGYYLKLGRNISQNTWIRENGSKKYPLAIEDVIRYASTYIGAKDIALHIAGREDVDVRVLGNGRPLVIEFKNPSKRNISLLELENILNSFSKWLKFKIEMKVDRNFISRLKQSASSTFKIYRAIVLVENTIDSNKLAELERFFKGLVIYQRTPLRVLRRKKDIMRKKRVFSIKTLQLSSNLFEAFIKCEGGLYVKELISGDNGRTAPSFSEFLGTQARCIELDVLHVHEYI